MSQTGDDCYFYYYSTCAKGDMCPFRHQPAALGCEVMCDLWEKGRCVKKACKFRHMVIEKDRSNIPCIWENQPSGCTKPYCPFLHSKPKSIPTSQVPPHGQPSAVGQSIPTLGGSPRAHARPIRPQGPHGMGRAGPHMYNGPPRMNMAPHQGPYMGGPRTMQQRPMGYEGYIHHGQPPNHMLYHMHPNNQMHMTPVGPYSGMIPGMIPGLPGNMVMNNQRGNYHRSPSSDYEDSDEDYTSSDFSDVSLSDDERRVKTRDNSHRKVQSPRRAKNRREVRQRNDRGKRTESKPTRDSHNSRKSTRRKNERDERERDEREKEWSHKDSVKTRIKPRRHSEDKDTEKERSQSPTEKPKSEQEDQKGDIKVKTLEEILREKALKNLHERTAQKKKAQMDAEKGRKGEGDDSVNSDSPEPILKSVVSISKAEPTSIQKEEQAPSDHDDDVNGDDGDDNAQHVSKKELLRSPKTIIRSIIDPDNEAHKSASTSTTSRKTKEVESKTKKESDDKGEQISDNTTKRESTVKTNSDLSKIKIKTFEEIMEEKRQRKAHELQPSTNKLEVVADAGCGHKEDDKKVEEKRLVTRRIHVKVPKKTSENASKETNIEPDCGHKEEDTKTTVEEKPLVTRRIHVKVSKKPTENASKETNTDPGKLITGRKVKTAPRKGLINKEVPPSQVSQEQKTKENKKTTDVQKAKPTNIVIKSFDEIIREKRQRQQEQCQSTPSQPPQDTSTKTVKKPSIIRKKPELRIKPVEQTQVQPRTFKSRKLKVIGRQGLSTKPETDYPPTVPVTCNTQTIGEPSSQQSTAQSSIPGAITTPGYPTPTHVTNEDDDEDDDDDSWEHEELPAVPLETPTLEDLPKLPDVASKVLQPTVHTQIPERTIETNTTASQKLSPTKRARSSLEELFGVPCDETNSRLDKSESLSEDEEDEDVSPAKKVKTFELGDKEFDKEIKTELSKKDDIDFELEEEIAHLSPDKDFDVHESLNEHDILRELEEMIND